MVDSHAGGDAYRHSCLLCPFGNGGDGSDAVGAQTQTSVVCLASCGKCGTSGCGVRDAVAGTVRGGVGGVGETGKTQLSDADAAFEGSKIGFGSVYLIKSHAVADEVEYVFWRLCRSGTEGNGKE